MKSTLALILGLASTSTALSQANLPLKFDMGTQSSVTVPSWIPVTDTTPYPSNHPST